MRYVKLDYALPVQPVAPPLRILAVVSNPSGVPALDVEREYDHLQEALLPGGREQRRSKLERLGVATLGALEDRLRDDEVHVIHFIGHGYYDEADKWAAWCWRKPTAVQRTWMPTRCAHLRGSFGLASALLECL